MGKLKKNKETNVTSEEIKEDKIMTEETDEETSVIQEQIKPWHKRKFKKVLSVVGFSLLAGIIFGIAARFLNTRFLLHNLQDLYSSIRTV